MNSMNRFSSSFSLEAIDGFGQDSRRLSADHLQQNLNLINGSPNFMTSRSSSDLDLRQVSEQLNCYGLRWNSTSTLPQNGRQDRKTPIKRTKDIILEHLSSKRVRTSDPFASPNPLLKDFRLSATPSEPKESVDSDQFFCRFCNVSASNLKELADHLRGKRHKKNYKKEEKCEDIRGLRSSDPLNDLMRILSQTREPLIGLDQIRAHMDDKTKYYCLSCDCHLMPATNLIQHIKGSKHKRNAMSSVRCGFGHIKHTVLSRQRAAQSKRCVGPNVCPTKSKSSGTFMQPMSGKNSRRHRDLSELKKQSQKESLGPTLSDLNSESEMMERSRNLSNVGTPATKTPKPVPNPNETKLQTDCLSKTIQNFKTIRDICDEMIGFYAERHNQSFGCERAVSASSCAQTCSQTKASTQIKSEK